MNPAKQRDVVEAKRKPDPTQTRVEDGDESQLDALVQHLLAMPDVGEDADFERDSSLPRDIEL